MVRWGWLILVLGVAAVPVRADGDAAARALVDKVVKALGGEEKLAKYQTASWKGKANIQAGGQAITLMHQGIAQDASRYRLDFEIQVNGMNNQLLAVVNGDKGWVRANNQTNDLPKEAVPFVRDGIYALRAFHLLPAMKDKAYQLSHLGELKIGERMAVGLQIKHKDRRDVNLYFDKETSLPVKSELRLPDPNGGMEMAVEYHYAEFKEFEGVKYFTQITVKVNDQEYVSEISEVRPVEKPEDATFEKP